MPKKKSVLIGVSFPEVDTLHEQHNLFINFVCDENKIQDTIIEKLLDKNKISNYNTIKKDIETALKNRLKNNVQFIGSDMVIFEEISLSERLKSSDQYIYHLFDYNGSKSIYGTFKTIINEVNKRIKNKYVNIWYNGITEKIEYSENEFGNILSRMSPPTHEVGIAQIKGNGDDDNLIIITPYKLMM